jgi:hypothetical protein
MKARIPKALSSDRNKLILIRSNNIYIEDVYINYWIIWMKILSLVIGEEMPKMH